MVLFALFMILASPLPVSASCKVEYEGGAEGLVAAPDDFFSEFPIMMPGDKEEEEIIIRNKQNNPTEFYFRTKLDEKLQKLLDEEMDITQKDGRSVQLLKKIKLTIWMQDSNQMIYEGNLAATSLQEGISLGKYDGWQEEKMKFQIEIPKELGNVYASNNTSVVWVFSVKEDSTITSSKDEYTDKEDPTVLTKPTIETTKSNGEKESSESVILGISDYSWMLGVGLLIAGILNGVCLILKKKG